MNIKGIKKQYGILQETLMVVGLIIGLIAAAIALYNKLTDSVDELFFDFLSFSNNVSYSHSKQDVVLLQYDEIVPFQTALFNTIDCKTYICNPFKVQKYPSNTYLKLNYKDNNLVSLSLYSKKMYSIFNLTPFPYKDISNAMDFKMFLRQQQEVSGNLENRDNKQIAYLITLFDNVTLYNIMDNNSNNHMSIGDCNNQACTHVFEYKNSPKESTQQKAP